MKDTLIRFAPFLAVVLLAAVSHNSYAESALCKQHFGQAMVFFNKAYKNHHQATKGRLYYRTVASYRNAVTYFRKALNQCSAANQNVVRKNIYKSRRNMHNLMCSNGMIRGDRQKKLAVKYRGRADFVKMIAHLEKARRHYRSRMRYCKNYNARLIRERLAKVNRALAMIRKHHANASKCAPYFVRARAQAAKGDRMYQRGRYLVARKHYRQSVDIYRSGLGSCHQAENAKRLQHNIGQVQRGYCHASLNLTRRHIRTGMKMAASDSTFYQSGRRFRHAGYLWNSVKQKCRDYISAFEMNRISKQLAHVIAGAECIRNVRKVSQYYDYSMYYRHNRKSDLAKVFYEKALAHVSKAGKHCRGRYLSSLEEIRKKVRSQHDYVYGIVSK